MSDTITCFCCMEPVSTEDKDAFGWCNTCVAHHPITQRYIALGQLYGLDEDATVEWIRRKLTAIWN